MVLKTNPKYFSMGMKGFSFKPLASVFTENETLIVPKFQRDYNWTINEYGELWVDIE